MPQKREAPKQRAWSLALTDQQADKLRRDSPYLWRQLIDRGFIEADGSDSDRWRSDPRNTGSKA